MSYHNAIAVVLIIDLHHHVEDCGGMVIHRHAEIWIFGFPNCAECCCNGVVKLPDMGTWIFECPHHAKGYCDGAVTCFVTGLRPYVVTCFQLTRGSEEWPDAYLRMDLYVLAAWSRNSVTSQDFIKFWGKCFCFCFA
jgi:hypothetical protein